MTDRDAHGLVPGRTLWHYTCDHGHAALGDGEATLIRSAERWTERTGQRPTWNMLFVWLTDLGPRPDALALGLANLSGHLTCNRTAHRYRVLDTSEVLWWPRSARRLGVSREERADVEHAVGCRPAHWYVGLSPVRVACDPV